MSASDLKFFVSHPGTQHAPRVAAALEAAGQLEAYVTGYCYRADGWPERFARLLQRLGRTGPHARLLRRRFTGLPDERQRRLLFTAVLGALQRKLSGEGDYRRSDLLFDRAMSRLLQRTPRDLYAFHNSCVRSGRATKAAGHRFFLDMPIGHPRAAQKILPDEFARWGIKAADSELWFPVSDDYFQEIAEEFAAADLIFAGSEFVRGTLVDEGIPPERIVVNPYGVDIQMFKPAPKAPLLGRKLRLLFTGQVGIRKGTPDLLQALATLGDRVECRLCGHYNLPKSLESLWPSNATYLGAVDRARVAQEMAWADIFVFPTLFEGSSLASYEALASGLPVITTPNCGSIVEHGREGFIVPIRSPAGVAEAVTRFLDDPRLCAAMGEQARRKAENHTWADYSTRLLAQLRSIPSRRP